MSLVDTASAGSWDSLELSPFVSETIQSLGFSSMTPVQASVIPLFLHQHKDVVVQAVTGSGKTLAFVVPLLEKLARRETLLKDDQVGGIIICPTRELAIQTHKVVDTFIKAQTASMDTDGSTSSQRVLRAPLLLIGGNSTLREDIRSFRSLQSDILVGTPGRLEEFLLGSSSLTPSGSKKKQGKSAATAASAPPRALKSVCSVKELEMLILDEADRVLELGYQLSINRIIGILPKQRRTGCFSATMSEGLGELCRVGLRNPVRVVVKVERKLAAKTASATQDQQERNTPATLQNTFVVCKARHKLLRLLQHLQSEIASEDEPKKFIVYFATCACVDYFYKLLSPMPQLSMFTLYSLHGQQTPSKRTSTYTSFLSPAASSKSPHQVLFCTDVAARGLDLPSVDVVIQFDPPQDPKQFNHRAGRTARAGRKGKAVVLLCEGREEEYVEFLKRRGVPLRAEYDMDGGELDDSLVEKQETQMQKSILGDRDLAEKGTKAFVSFVRSYSKHEASYIFTLKGYDLLGLAKCFGLLRLPKMPELKEVRKDGSWLDTEVDWSTYAYKDKNREKARLEALTKEEKDGVAPAATELKRKNGLPKATQAWSNKVEARERRDLRKEKKVRKRAYLKSQSEQALSDGKGDANQDESADELDGFSSEDDPVPKRAKTAKASKGEMSLSFAATS